ncbi:TlpA family protein disulfide reductase [Kordiimonas marina]|uniref:TlpA family protein disulfide reductase n=1 Tax=Kordiimonas marina TaxID=2872312 RepID=UPI001FF5460B|nr:TlpA disulfide reductase family protein [Kordiimonas marina]MCJ9428643.1 TlpA family protein disulfide reductase [Kordiimonas marina]
MKSFLVAAALVAGLVSAPAVMAEATQASPLVAHMEDGTAVPLAGFPAGRPAVVKFWATWCVECRHEMPELQRMYRRYGDKLSFVLVDIGFNETPAKVAAFLKQHGYSFPFVFDKNAQLLRAMHVFGTPTHILLDARGDVIYRAGALDDRLRAQIASLADGRTGQGGEQ